MSLETLLAAWRQRLTEWSISGQLEEAARMAFHLQDEPRLLKKRVARWSSGEFSDLPPIVLRRSRLMHGAAGAYAITTGTIYLNQDWLQTASPDWIMAVLTEELGHHLDGILHVADTPGDEGYLFCQRINGMLADGSVVPGRSAFDHGAIVDEEGRRVDVEFSDIPKSQWTRFIGGSALDFDSIASLEPGQDGAIFVLRESLNYYRSSGETAQYTIYRISADGSLVASPLLLQAASGGTADIAPAMDGSLYLLYSYSGYGVSPSAKVIKYTPSYQRSWARTIQVAPESQIYQDGSISMPFGDDIKCISALSDGSFVVAGSCLADGKRYLVLSKYDKDGGISVGSPGGSPVWRRQFLTSGSQVVWNLATGSDGSVYITGRIDGDLNGSSAIGNGDAFVSCYDSSGNYRWSRIFGSNGYESGAALAVDSAGNIYVSAVKEDSYSGSTNQQDGGTYVNKYNGSGVLLWSSFLPGKKLWGLRLGTDGGVYLSGEVRSGVGNAFVAKYGADGVNDWSLEFGDPGKSDCANQIGFFADMSILVGGFTYGSIDGQSSSGINDIFLSRYAVGLPKLTLAADPAVEGRDAFATATITVDEPSAVDLSVQYTTFDRTAIAGSDYSLTTGTLIIPAGATSGMIKIPIIDNGSIEAKEMFGVRIQNPWNAVIVNSDVSVDILDGITSSLTTALAPNLETLGLVGAGSVDATGNAGANFLEGNSGNNVLAGLAGDDVYVFTANENLGTDSVVELSGQGTDTLGFSLTLSAIRLNLGVLSPQQVNRYLSLTLSGKDVIENATGGRGDDVLIGNSLANTLLGGVGSDRLLGLAGADLLAGGLGQDLLVGGAGADGFRFASGSAFSVGMGDDCIADFVSGEDKIQLSKKTFSSIASGVASPLTSFAMVGDDSLVDASPAVIVYSAASGGLFYNLDATFTGASKVFEFASLATMPPALFASDFVVIA